MQPSIFSRLLSQANRSLLSICGCFLIITVLWVGVCLDNSSIALAKLSEAELVQIYSGAIASQPNVLERLKDEVNDDLTEKISTSDKPGFADAAMQKVKSVMGQSKRSFNNAIEPTESIDAEIDGQTEENIAKIQGKATNSGQGVANAIEDVMGDIKNRVN